MSRRGRVVAAAVHMVRVSLGSSGWRKWRRVARSAAVEKVIRHATADIDHAAQSPQSSTITTFSTVRHDLFIPFQLRVGAFSGAEEHSPAHSRFTQSCRCETGRPYHDTPPDQMLTRSHKLLHYHAHDVTVAYGSQRRLVSFWRLHSVRSRVILETQKSKPQIGNEMAPPTLPVFS